MKIKSQTKMMRINIYKKLVFLFAGLSLLGLFALASKPALATNPATISFQGKVVSNVSGSVGTNITDGTYSIVFRIYNTSSPTMTTSCTSTASCLWQETQASVSVTNGIFQVELGSSCALTSGSCNNTAGGPINYSSTSALYLTMQFNGDTSGSNGGFMSPLIHINSVPFALQADNAANAASLGGIAAANYVQLAQGLQTDTSTTNPSIFINKNNSSGTPNILQLQKGGVDVFTVANDSTIAVRGGSNSVATYTSEQIASQAFNNATYWSCSGWTTTGTTAQHNTGNTSACSATATNLTVTSASKYVLNFRVNGTTNTAESLIASLGGDPHETFGVANGTDFSFVISTINTNALTFTPSNNYNGTITLVSVTKQTQVSSSLINIDNSDASVGIEIRSGGSGLSNTFIGLNSGKQNSTGVENTALGSNTLSSNVSGNSNVAIGDGALTANTSGSNNIAIGSLSLNNNQNGGNNVGIGTAALESNQSGTHNVALGYSTLNSNLTGVGNTALGTNAMDVNSYGNYNTAVGFNALDGGDGNYNASLGFDALGALTTGSNNSGLGSYAGAYDPNVTSFVSLSNLQNATVVGYGAQAQANNVVILGGQGANAANIGIGTTSPTNVFSISPDIYDTGTAYQDSGSAGVAGTVIHGSGTTWTSSMVGLEFIFASGEKETITGFTSTTQLTGSVSQLVGLVGAKKAYRLHNPAFYVSSTGQTSIRTSTNSTTAFQVQNAANSMVLAVDSTNKHLKIFGANGTDYADIYYDSSTSTAYYGASTGAAVLGSGTGATDISAGSGAAVTITGNAASNFTTTAGLLTLQGAGGASLLSTTTTAVTVDSTTTGNVVIGATNNTNAKNVSLGNNNSGSTVDIDGGTGATGIEIGNTTTAHGIQIGSNATAANAVLLGGANASSTLTLEAGTAASALQIGNSASAHGIQIGAGGAAAGNAQTIVIGSNSTTTASKVTLQAGNGVTSGSFVGVSIGGSSADANQILFQLHTANNNFGAGVDVSAGCTTTLNQGAMYYSSVSNSVHACIGGFWEDMVSTAALGLQLFGVVPDSGTNAGDLAGASALPNGPCKVSEGGTTSTVSWTGCTAYSGGRKVIVAAGTQGTTAGSSATVIWQHLCLTGTNGTPTLSAIGVETANLATVSMPGVNNPNSPILCLADIKVTNGSAVITGIYQTATYTTTTKEFATNITNAAALGHLVKSGTTTPGSVTPTTAVAETKVIGVVVASSASTTTTAISVIVALSGPAWVKSITGTNAVGDFVIPTATQGYANTGTFTSGSSYLTIGLARTAWTSACGTNSLGCNSSILVNVNPR